MINPNLEDMFLIHLPESTSFVKRLSQTNIDLMLQDPNFEKKDTLPSLQSNSQKPIHTNRWMLSDQKNNTKLAHISMCIKDNKQQTLASLVLRLAYGKQMKVKEVATVLLRLQDQKRLFYYSPDIQRITAIVNWTPGEDNILLESIAAYRARSRRRARNA